MIDREKVMQALDRISKDKRQYFAGSAAEMKEQLGLQELAEDALALLKDQPEIVRCKDCKYYEQWEDDHICGMLGSYYGNKKPDDYCSDGRRKE